MAEGRAVTLRAAAFAELTGAEVYAVLALRAAVFVVEQRCVYLDPDGLDEGAWHVLAEGVDGLVGTARVLPAPWRVGRVVVAPAARGTGLGRRLVEAAIDLVEARAPGAPIGLAAQAHLEAFYASLGFARCGPVHDEDGIPHVEMRRG